MKIGPISTDTSNLVSQQNVSFINTYNRNLLNIQKQIENQPEMAMDTRREINNKLRSALSELHDSYKKLCDDIKPASVAMKKLQLLRIKYSLTSIKCGDADWETFQT